jgi:hypothetical protein
METKANERLLRFMAQSPLGRKTRPIKFENAFEVTHAWHRHD